MAPTVSPLDNRFVSKSLDLASNLILSSTDTLCTDLNQFKY